MVRGLDPADVRRLHHVGALSLLGTTSPAERPPDSLPSPRPLGTWRRPPHQRPAPSGGGRRTRLGLVGARGARGSWRDDPSAAIDAASVVVIQAGESAVADVAARRRPALIVPAPRPFDEQQTTGRALAAAAWPCRVEGRFPATGWAARLAEAGCPGRAGVGRLVRRACRGAAGGVPGAVLVTSTQEQRVTPTTAVVTIAHGRHRHLRRQHAVARAAARLPDHYVVVAMDDPPGSPPGRPSRRRAAGWSGRAGRPWPAPRRGPQPRRPDGDRAGRRRA